MDWSFAVPLLVTMTAFNVVVCLLVVWVTKHVLLPKERDVKPGRVKKFIFAVIWNFPALLCVAQIWVGMNAAFDLGGSVPADEAIWMMLKCIALFGLVPFVFYVFFVMPHVESWFRRMGFKWTSSGAEYF